MSHSCPDCGQTCYCGGDIDDCSFDNTPEQMRCGHCGDEPEDDEDDEPCPTNPPIQTGS